MTAPIAELEKELQERAPGDPDDARGDADLAGELKSTNERHAEELLERLEPAGACAPMPTGKTGVLTSSGATTTASAAAGRSFVAGSPDLRGSTRAAAATAGA